MSRRSDNYLPPPPQGVVARFTFKDGKVTDGVYVGPAELSYVGIYQRLMVDVGDPTGPHSLARWAIKSIAVLRPCGGCERLGPVAEGDYLCADCRA